MKSAHDLAHPLPTQPHFVTYHGERQAKQVTIRLQWPPLEVKAA